MASKFLSKMLLETGKTVTLPYKDGMKAFERSPYLNVTVLNSLIYVHKNELSLPEKSLSQIVDLILEQFIEASCDPDAHNQIAQGFMHLIEFIIKPEWGLHTDNQILIKVLDLLCALITKFNIDNQGIFLMSLLIKQKYNILSVFLHRGRIRTQ